MNRYIGIAAIASIALIVSVSTIGTMSKIKATDANANTAEPKQIDYNTENTTSTVMVEDTLHYISDISDVTVPKNIMDIKKEIWHKMLNSVDYYNAVAGRVIFADNVSDTLCVMFQTNIDTSNAYTHISDVDVPNSVTLINQNIFEYTVTNKYDLEVFTEGDSIITLYQTDHTGYVNQGAVLHRENSGRIPDSERIVYEGDGVPGYYYRCDPTNTYLAKECIFPQEMAFGFLSDYEMWEIERTDEYVGRNCYVISGKTSHDYGGKTGVSSFIFYVDQETGVLLRYLGYDDAGDIHAFLVTESIAFDDDVKEIIVPNKAEYTFCE